MKFRIADCACLPARQGLRIEQQALGSRSTTRPIQNLRQGRIRLWRTKSPPRADPPLADKIQNFIAPEVICGVEDGWSGMRRFSLDAAQEGRAVLVVIRDAVEPKVLDLITTPPGMRILAIERFWFRARLIWEMVNAAVRGRLRQVVVSRAKTRRDLSPIAWILGARMVQLADTDHGYRLQGSSGQVTK